jgi:hypothetical protein
VLWTGDRWLRWQPWAASFGALSVLDGSENIADATCSPDGGLAMWLDGETIRALRFDVRGTYSGLQQPLLVSDATDVAPDRLPAPGVVDFDPALGLVLGPGASAFVTDRSYADVALDVDAPTGEPALVVLRDELGSEVEVGGPACTGALSPGAPSSLHVVRRAATVTWSTGSASGTCLANPRQDARLSLGLRAPEGVNRSVARNLRVTRLGTP